MSNHEQASLKNAPRAQAFIDAVKSRDFTLLGELLAEEPDLVACYDRDSFGATPLIHASGRQDREMVEFLLRHGADINQRSDWWAGGFGVLPHDDREFAEYLISLGAAVDAHTAAQMGLLDRLRSLLDADPSLVHARGGDGQLPLHYAGTRAAVDMLLERGADLHARDIDHESTAAQYQATRNGDVTSYLIERGAEADIFMSAACGDVAAIRRLLDERPGLVNERITRALFSTSANTPAEHIYFYTIGSNATPLHAAAGQGRADAARLLLERGADATARGGYDDSTPLHSAAWGNHVTAAEVLLDGGAGIDEPSGAMHHNEPLGWAIVAGNPEMVELLLRRGARVRNMHVEDADAGVNGAFCFTRAPRENFRRIRDILSARA